MTERNPDNLTADLSAYLDGELDEQRQREVERLLAESADARQTLEELRAVSEQVATLPRLRAPATLTILLAERAEKRLRDPVQTSGRRFRTLRLFAQLTAAAAAVAACVFIGYQIRDYSGAALQGLAPAPTQPRSATKSLTDASTTLQKPERLADSAAKPVVPGGTPAAESASNLSGEADAEASGAFSSADDAPSADIVIATRNQEEYLRAAVVLAYWNQAGGAAPTEPPRAATQQRIEGVYQVGAAELPTRIDQLAENVASPSQVQVQMNFNAGRSGLLTQPVDQATPAASGVLGQGFVDTDADGVRDVPRANGGPAQPRTGSGVYATQSKSAEGHIVAKDQPPAESPASAAVPASPSPPRSGKPFDTGQRESGRGRAAGGGTGGRGAPTPHGGLDDKRDEETKARNLHERHGDATAEPRLDIVLVQPPESQPALRQIVKPEAEAASTRAAQPAEAPGRQKESAEQSRLAEQLFEHVYLGMPLIVAEQNVATGSDRDVAPAREQITLHVTLLPPPAPAERPASAPTSGPTSPQ